MRYIQPRRSNVAPKHTQTKVVGKVIVAIIIVAALAFSSLYFLNNTQHTKLASSEPQTSNIALASDESILQTTSLSAENTAILKEAIESAIAANSADVSVSIIDVSTGDTYHYGYDGAFVAASIGKLLTATLYLHEVDENQASLTDTISGQTASDLLTNMIEISDNNAWHTLNTYLSSASLEQWTLDNGWTTYGYDTNTVTSNDIADLLDKLYQNQLLSQSSTKLLLNHMANANETNHIVQYVPSGVNVYHKAGWLTDYVHDAAIIDDGTRPFVLVVFTKDTDIYGSGEATSLYQAITDAALTAFDVKQL